jgi:hypothetical protein
VQLENIGEMTNEELQDLYDCNIKFSDESIDSQEFNLFPEKKQDKENQEAGEIPTVK